MSRRALFVILLIAFLDSMAYGLVYPLFPRMLFGESSEFVASTTSEAMRGFWLGLLLSATPVIQLIVSPFAGSWSDRIGRRTVIIACVSFGFLGFFAAAFSVHMVCLPGLILSRIILGVSLASFAVANACIADVCTAEEKSQVFPWVSMAFGLGFALGPSLGGVVSGRCLFASESLARPFWVAGVLDVVILLFVILWLPETRSSAGTGRVSPSIREVMAMDSWLIRLLAATFLFSSGWSFYVDFISVLWLHKYDLTASQIGVMYSVGAICYVCTCGLFVGPILRRYAPVRVLEVASLLLCGAIWVLLINNSLEIFWVILPVQHFLAAFLFPVAATAISGRASEEHQGRVMGFHASAECLGVGLAPVLSGPLLGVHLLMPVWVGGLLVLCCHICVRAVRARSCA